MYAPVSEHRSRACRLHDQRWHGSARVARCKARCISAGGVASRMSRGGQFLCQVPLLAHDLQLFAGVRSTTRLPAWSLFKVRGGTQISAGLRPDTAAPNLIANKSAIGLQLRQQGVSDTAALASLQQKRRPQRDAAPGILLVASLRAGDASRVP